MSKYIVEMDDTELCEQCLFLGSGFGGAKCNIIGTTVKPVDYDCYIIKRPQNCPLKEFQLESTYKIEFDFKSDSNWVRDPKLREFDNLATAVGEAVLECGEPRLGKPPAMRVVEVNVLPEAYQYRIVWPKED